MKLYEVRMGTVDLAFLVNLQFWAGFAIASLMDQVKPPPEKKSDINEGLLMLEIIIQLIGMGYVYALFAPTFLHVANPMWRLMKKTHYKSHVPHKLIAGQFIMVGLTFGSTNLLTKLQLVARSDLG